MAVTFIKGHLATTDASTFTFSSTSTGGTNDIGATASDRQVIVGAVIAATATAGRTISSVTAGGVTMTNPIVKGGTQSATELTLVSSVAHGFYYVSLTTATSIAVVLTATTTVANAAISVWSATEAAATATYGFNFASASGFALTAPNTALTATIGTGGFCLFMLSNIDAVQGSGFTTTSTNDFSVTVETLHERHRSIHNFAGGNMVPFSATSAGNMWGSVFLAFDSTVTSGTAADFYRKNPHRLGTVVGRRKAA